jgi:hypothetical protein
MDNSAVLFISSDKIIFVFVLHHGIHRQLNDNDTTMAEADLPITWTFPKEGLDYFTVTRPQTGVS